MVQELNYGRINMFWFLIGLARCGQMRFYFSSALPAAGKGIFIFQEPCPSWANVFLFFKSFARAWQAVYFFNSPLPALGKQDSNVLFHIHSFIGL